MAQDVWSVRSGRLGIHFPDLAAPVRSLKEGLFHNVRTGFDHAPGKIPWMEAALAALCQDVEAIGPNLNTSMRLVAQRALDLTRATGAAIAQSQDDEMVCVATAGSDAPALGARVQTRSGFSGECIRA